MKFKFEIKRPDFARAVVWVYDRTDGATVVTRFNGETTDRNGTISWDDPYGEYKARIIVYYTWDIVPPASQDVWVSNLPCSEGGVFEETVVIRSLEAEKKGEYEKAVSVTTTGGGLANWMEREQATLGGRELRDVILPGTHDSGAFDPKLGGAAQTQDLTIGQQLKYGVRVLDFRVTRVREDKDGLVAGRDYLHHNGYTRPSMSLERATSEIVEFAERHRGEVILLNLRAGSWCEDVNPLLPTAPGRWTDFTLAEKQAFRDELLKLLQGRSGASLVYDHATFGASDPRPIGRRTLDEIVSSGRNIVIFGGDPYPSGKVYWPDASNRWGTWNYVKWISSAGKTLDQRMYGPEVAVSEKLDGIPLDPNTDQKRWESGDGVAPGFVPTYEAVHRRRLDCMDSGDPLGDKLIDFGPNFATLDNVSAATVVARQALDWMKGWEQNPDLKGALNVVNLDFFTRVPFVPRVIRLNRERT